MLRHLPPFHCALLFAVLATVLCTFSAANGAEPDALELFEKQIRPTLVDHCIRCHGEKKQQGGLRLDSRAGWMSGGDSGPAIIPGDPQQSRLVQAVRYESAELEMPPKGVLPATTIAAIEKWITLGAPDPRSSGPSRDPRLRPPTVQQGRSFWSFQPVGDHEPPTLKDDTWPQSDIDRFILSELERKALRPAADADRRTLLRRAYFDLIGLPPTPQQIGDFLDDRSPDAYARLIDQLLDSPQFGERWGRHWLDVVRFAQSSGGGRTLLFPEAWRYRDYVIDSFNADLPYDQFLQEQIAGDLLPSSDWQDRQRKLIATAFLLLGPTNYELQDKDILEMDVVDEQLDTIGKSMLGMTIGCARCHDHKFDPIPAKDYYAMAGILKSTKAMIHSNVSQWNTVPLPLSPQEEAVIAAHNEQLADLKARLAEATARWKKAGGKPDSKKNAKPASIEPASLAGIVVDDPEVQRIGQWKESVSIPGFVGAHYIHDETADKGRKSVSYRPAIPRRGRYEVRISYTPSSNRSTRVPVHIHHVGGESVVRVNQKAIPPIDGILISLGVFEFDPAGEPQVVISNEGTEDGVVIADAVALVATDLPSIPKSDERNIAEGSLRADADNKTKVNADAEAKRAAVKQLKKEVDALTKELKSLQQSAPPRPVVMATTDDDDAGDIHLAISGVVHNKGPMTPRGVLQVASSRPMPEIPAGQSGRKELADWISSEQNPLTARVMANRVWHWLMGRGIVSTVDNFGSMGQAPTHPELLDHLAASFVENEWSVKSLIRQIMNSRVYQLGSEVDGGEAALVDPGNRLWWRMNRKRLRAEDIRDALLLVSGELDITSGGANIRPGTNSEYGYKFQSKRRSVYVPVFRNSLPDIFQVFDFADPNIQGGKRTTSTIASQALLLMNHPFVIERSQAAARKLFENGPTDTNSRVQQVYQQVLGRVPSDEESSIAVDFIAAGSQDGDDRTRFAMLYQTLFQCIDFRHLN